VSRYQKGKTNLDFAEARDSECQWHQLSHMQVCTSLQTDNHASTHHSVFTGQMPFLSPNQQCQSTEGTSWLNMNKTYLQKANKYTNAGYQSPLHYKFSVILIKKIQIEESNKVSVLEEITFYDFCLSHTPHVYLL